MNADIVLFLNARAIESPLLLVIVVLIAEWGVLMIPSIALLIIWMRKPRVSAHVYWGLFISSFSAVSIALLVSFLTSFPRPFLAFPDRITPLVFGGNPLGSFPSGHTAILSAFAGAFFFMGRRLFGSVLLFCAFFVGMSRVFAGVHYPIDVFAGFFVGLGTSYIVMNLQRWILAETSSEPPHTFLHGR